MYFCKVGHLLNRFAGIRGGMRLRDRFPLSGVIICPARNELARKEEEQQLRVNSITA
jgi:hypothetical protein